MSSSGSTALVLFSCSFLVGCLGATYGEGNLVDFNSTFSAKNPVSPQYALTSASNNAYRLTLHQGGVLISDASVRHRLLADAGQEIAKSKCKQKQLEVSKLAAQAQGSSGWVHVQLDFECGNVAYGQKFDAWVESDKAEAACKTPNKGAPLLPHVQCINVKSLAVFKQAGYKHMDLVELLHAHRTVMATKLDEGQLEEVEYKLRALEMRSKINTAVIQREAAISQLTAPINSEWAGRSSTIGGLSSALNNFDQELQLNGRIDSLQWDLNMLKANQGAMELKSYYDTTIPTYQGFTGGWGQ